MKVGLLSTGHINVKLAAGARVSERAEVVAIASRELAKAQAQATELGVAGAHGSYEALLSDDAIDAVYVSLPNGMHHEWTMRALAAGKHVLCEKPYSRHPAEVNEAYDTAERAGLVLAEAFMWRHHPQTIRLAELLAEGAIGELRHVRASFSFLLEDPANIRLSPDLAGGALMDLGCYCVSGVRLLAGDPERCAGIERRPAGGVDVRFAGVLEHPRGVTSQIACAFDWPFGCALEAIGSTGSLLVRDPWHCAAPGIEHAPEDGPVEQIAISLKDPYACELDDLAAAIDREHLPRLGRADALGQARTIAALYEAAGTGTSVTLERL